jgi:hypothetical protein
MARLNKYDRYKQFNTKHGRQMHCIRPDRPAWLNHQKNHLRWLFASRKNRARILTEKRLGIAGIFRQPPLRLHRTPAKD